MLDFRYKSDREYLKRKYCRSLSKKEINCDIQRVSMKRSPFQIKQLGYYKYSCINYSKHKLKFLANMDGKQYQKTLEQYIKLCKKAKLHNYMEDFYDHFNDFKDYSYKKWPNYYVEDGIIRKYPIQKSKLIPIDNYVSNEDYKKYVDYNRKNIINPGRIISEVTLIAEQNMRSYYLGKLWVQVYVEEYDYNLYVLADVEHKPFYSSSDKYQLNSELYVCARNIEVNYNYCKILGIDKLHYYEEYKYKVSEDEYKYGIKDTGIKLLNPHMKLNQLKSIVFDYEFSKLH